VTRFQLKDESKLDRSMCDVHLLHVVCEMIQGCYLSSVGSVAEKWWTCEHLEFYSVFKCV